MSGTPELYIYEASLYVDAGLGDKLDDWLDGYAADLRQRPGIAEVTIWSVHDAPERVDRVLRICAESAAHLQDFQDNEVPPASAEFAEAFEGDNRWQGRMLRSGSGASAKAEPLQHCLNCKAVLGSQYCSQCGQRSQTRLISIGELLRDAFGDLFEFDSRLWRTLVPLAIRPGLLTAEYLQGRRARYMPPFRMYLVMSLAFYVIAFFDPYRDFSILFEPEAIAANQQMEAARRSAMREQRGREVGGDRTGPFNNCSFDGYNPDALPDWVSRRLPKERLQTACSKIFADNGSGLPGLADRLIENIPTGLFLLLPLMALVMLVLHPLSSRYYVEHLLFVVHFHTFSFMLMSTEILFGRMVINAGLPVAIETVAKLSAYAYIPAYLYLAMRRVYGQGHLLTALKWVVLVATYIAGIAVIMAISALIAALSA